MTDKVINTLKGIKQKKLREKKKKKGSRDPNRFADNIMRRTELISDKVDIEVKPLNKGAQSVPGGLSKKDMKPITMNMGGQVEGVEDLTTEFEVTD